MSVALPAIDANEKCEFLRAGIAKHTRAMQACKFGHLCDRLHVARFTATLTSTLELLGTTWTAGHRSPAWT